MTTEHKEYFHVDDFNERKLCDNKGNSKKYTKIKL